MPANDFSVLLDRIDQGTAAAEDVMALKQWAEAAPGHATAHVALAHACERNGRRSEAHQSWQRAYLLLPSSPAVHAGLRRTAPSAKNGGGASRPPEASSSEQPDDRKAPFQPMEEEPPASEGIREGTSPVEEAPPEKETSPEEKKEEPAPQRPSSPAAPATASDNVALRELQAALPEHAKDEDLDGLIEELQDARIEPTPDPDDVPAPNLETSESDMVSPTLARIYENQGQYTEAARAYRRLAEKHPAQADEYRQQAEALQARADQARADQDEE